MNREEAQKKSEDALHELAESLRLGRSEKMVHYLDMLSRFHQYSFGNCMMIAMQMPTASHVAGFSRWKQLGRWVKKGEKGIAILAPMIGKRKDGDTPAKPDTVDEGKSKVVYGFRVVYVYDVTQTDGKPLPDFAEIQGDPGKYQLAIVTLIESLGIEFAYADHLGGANGVSLDGRIEVVQSLPPAQKFSTSVHELAHELLHRGDRRSATSRSVRETEAEAVAYAVCRFAGLECSTRASDYIQLYAGDEKLLHQSLEYIRNTAAQIIEALSDVHLESEKGVEVSHAGA